MNNLVKCSPELVVCLQKKKNTKFKLLISKDLIFLHVYLCDYCNCLIFSYTDFSIFGSHIHFLLWCFSGLWSETVPFSTFLVLFPQVEAKQRSGPRGQRLAPLTGWCSSGEVRVFAEERFCVLEFWNVFAVVAWPRDCLTGSALWQGIYELSVCDAQCLCLTFAHRRTVAAHCPPFGLECRLFLSSF